LKYIEVNWHFGSHSKSAVGVSISKVENALMTVIEQGKNPEPEENYRIMLIDGPAGYMQQVKQECKNAGQEVVVVTTVEESRVFLATKDNVDVIVAEAFLEHDSIFELLKSIRQDPRHNDVPVLLMAAEPGAVGEQCLSSIRQVADILGAHRFIYMHKFDMPRLMSEIRSALAEMGLPKKLQQ
jgi:CheY-like chemotaxis protein